MQPEVLRCVCDVVYVSMLLCAVLVVYGCVFAVTVAGGVVVVLAGGR